MIIEKQLYWDKLVDHFYDNVHWNGGPKNIYDWLEKEYNIVSSTGSQVLECKDKHKATWFIMKWS